MSTTYVQTVDNLKLYAERAVQDKDGNQIDTTYAKSGDLATVATTGDYDDLQDKPDLSVYAESADLATVATTGDYSDLTGTPSIPTATSDLTNDSGFITINDVPAQVQPDWDATSGLGEILNKPDLSVYAETADLATVATTGSYTDLSNQPTIPSGAQLVPAATAADADKVLTVNSLGVPGWAVIPEQPTGLFQATYGTSTYNEVRDAVTANKIVYCYVNGRMAFLAYVSPNFYEFQYYRSNSSSLGTDSVFVYQVSSSGWETEERAVKAGNIRYPVTQVNVNGSSAMTGTVANITIPAAPTVDQTYDSTSTNAQSGTAVAGAISTKQDTISDLATIRSGAQLGATAVQPAELATVARTGDYTDLIHTPSIPTATSDLTNDSGFITLSDVPAQVQTDWDATSGLGEILHKPDLSIYAESADLATVATTGSYDDLLDKPSIPAAQVNADWDASSGVAEILNKPSLATVATTGDYDDLSNKPSIPAAQVNSDWNAVSGVAEILNKPTLATVATSGSYNDLSNKPDLSVYAESADLATVATTGAYSDLTGTPTIPTATSDLTNDSGFITSADLPTVDQTYDATSANAQSGTAVAGAVATKQDVISDLATIRSGAQAGSTAVQPGDLATVATTGAYSDLTGTPTIPTATSDLTNDSGFITLSDVPAQVNADWNSSSGASEILHKPDLSIYAQSSSLATVATTGDYDDLTNKPSIPTVEQSYSSSSTNAQSGTAVAQAISGVDAVPDVTSSDDGKVLVATYSGGAGSYAWASTPPTNAVILDSSSTWSDFHTPYSAGRKDIYYKHTSSYSPFESRAELYLHLTAVSDVDGSSTNFTYALFEGAWHSASVDYTVRCQFRYSGNPLVHYDALTAEQSYSSSSTRAQSGVAVAQAISAVNQVPASTSADADKVLTVDSQGTPAWASAQAPITAGNGIDITNNVVSVDTSVVATQTDLAGKEDAFDVGTGLEMDTSGATPTLQVEAPVDIVAGPGIIIDNPDGNTLRVSVAQAEEVVLWSDASGSTTPTLDETLFNFDRCRVTYMGGALIPLEVSFDVVSGTNTYNLIGAYFRSDSNNFVQFQCTTLTLSNSGASATFSNGSRLWLPGNSSDTQTIKCTKIVGIHRIANN